MLSLIQNTSLIKSPKLEEIIALLIKAHLTMGLFSFFNFGAKLCLRLFIIVYIHVVMVAYLNITQIFCEQMNDLKSFFK